MSYTACEALLLVVVQNCTEFASTNTARANWKVLNSGASNHYAILRLDDSEIDWLSPNMYRVRWRTVIELWQRYTNDVDTKTNLYARLNNLIDGIQPFARLGDTENFVQDASVRGIGNPQEMWGQGKKGPAWLMIELRVEWHEEATVDEYFTVGTTGIGSMPRIG